MPLHKRVRAFVRNVHAWVHECAYVPFIRVCVFCFLLRYSSDQTGEQRSIAAIKTVEEERSHRNHAISCPIMCYSDRVAVQNINICSLLAAPKRHQHSAEQFPHVPSVLIRGSDMQRALLRTTRSHKSRVPPWQVSQGSSSVIAALSFITGIIRCWLNKPWSQTGICSHAPMINGWLEEHCLWLLMSQMSRPETITLLWSRTSKQWHNSQRSKMHICQIFTVGTKRDVVVAEFPQILLRYK